MNDHMRNLVRVQDIMSRIDGLQEKIAAVPAEVARLEKDLLASQAGLEAERARVQDLSKDRRHLEMELMGIESKITKYQAQLLDVKTNKEYQAMLHEIEGCKAERAKLDERILVEMEEAEKRGAAVKTLEQRLQQKQGETTRGKSAIDAEAAELKRQVGVLEEERRSLEAGIAAEYLQPFLKVARQRKGLALVAVRDERCAGCHVRVMPKLIQMVRRATGLIPCDSCKRFLYVPDDAPPVNAESTAR